MIKSVVLTILISLLSLQLLCSSELNIGWNYISAPMTASTTEFLKTYPGVRIVWGYKNGLWYRGVRDAADGTALGSLYPELSQVIAGKHYWLKVDSATTLNISTEGAAATNPATSCKSIKNTNSQGDGWYWIQPKVINHPIRVYCDMTTDGGGWTHLDFDYFKLIAKHRTNPYDPNVPSSVITFENIYISANKYMEFDTGIDFEEYKMKLSSDCHYCSVVDMVSMPAEDFNTSSIAFTSAVSIANASEFNTVPVSSFQALTVRTGPEIGALSWGTDLRQHDWKKGGEFGRFGRWENIGNLGSTTHFVFDTINRQPYIQSTPVTSKFLIKLIHDSNINVQFVSEGFGVREFELVVR